MLDTKAQNYIQEVLSNMPSDWLSLTTHRLDIYNESLAKTEFLNKFEDLYATNVASTVALSELPTAYDYIRLGHPLSCVLEWAIANLNGVEASHVISFSSKTIAVLAILRKNLLDGKHTDIFYTGTLPQNFDGAALKDIYGYKFTLHKVNNVSDIKSNQGQGSTIYLTSSDHFRANPLNSSIDFSITMYEGLGSVVIANQNENYISEIQHVRRRETIAMTPSNCQAALQNLIDHHSIDISSEGLEKDKSLVLKTIKEITDTHGNAVVASSGLSMQYAIMMGLIEDAKDNHTGKDIKFIVPTNCYGGTNDQARRVAACLSDVEVVDLAVDGDNDMVQSIEKVLESLAKHDVVPYIIAEIPTNPRVEVPDLEKLREALSKKRTTAHGNTAIEPVFILDQTFCPNVHFLGDGEILSGVKTIAYVSGSKFPSGGKCTAGYCVANTKADYLMKSIERHLLICDNEATALQYGILAAQMPSMLQRIEDAYTNTRVFVNFISKALPTAKINFVSEELAAHGFTPSVFSLDLPTKGDSESEREAYKRELNDRLINMMITEIPEESKYCVSYGQLQGCYWTIPATSTQGTTKEGDKDYIARVALSGNMDLEMHKQVFKDFVESL